MARKTERRYLSLSVCTTNLQFAALLLAWPAHADGSKPGIADILRRKTTPSFSLQDAKPSDSDAAARSKAAVPGMAWVRALGIPRPAQTLLIQSSARHQLNNENKQPATAPGMAPAPGTPPGIPGTAAAAAAAAAAAGSKEFLGCDTTFCWQLSTRLCSSSSPA